MLFALLAEALAIMARLSFFTALFRAACALAHKCLAFALAALCFRVLSQACAEIPEDLTAFAAKRGVTGARLEPACAYLTEWLKAAVLLLAPCRMASDIFYETGYNGRDGGCRLPGRRIAERKIAPNLRKMARRTSATGCIEYINRCPKRFRILPSRYRNKRRKFAQRTALIAGSIIHNIRLANRSIVLLLVVISQFTRFAKCCPVQYGRANTVAA